MLLRVARLRSIREPALNFPVPENTAVFTCLSVLDGSECICIVTHDEEDGAWQFLPLNGAPTVGTARVVSLKTIVDIDCSVQELADLQPGWRAWRHSKDAYWKREPS